MEILSVSVGLPRLASHAGQEISTGIFKEPVDGRVRVRRLGLEGDGQADRTVHGGVHMAVYAYPVEHYVFWERELDHSPFTHGQFGENLRLRRGCGARRAR